MKTLTILIISLFILGCSENQIEELAFRKTLEYGLIDLCGAKDKECINAVETQSQSCMEKSNWRVFLENQESEAELTKFTGKFYACIVDSEGNPYFAAN